MEIILNNNIFSFHESLWKQKVGAAMGSRPIPDYADNYLAHTTDKYLQDIGKNYDIDNEKAIQLLERFLDDYFSIFLGTTKELHQLLEEVNRINPNIKLTMKHTKVDGEAEENSCNCEPLSAIPFLDVLCSIKNGRIETDLYKKPTDRNQYLLPSSCHPRQPLEPYQGP